MGLGPDQPVYGLGSSHPDSIADIETVEQRATQYLELVRRIQPHGPYCLAGFCAGGLVVYEMAQQLAQANEPVSFVGMINAPYPGFPLTRVDGWVMQVQRLVHRVRRLQEQGFGAFSYIRNRLADRRVARANQRQLQQVAHQVEKNGFERDSIMHNQVLLDATMAVFERYMPRPYSGDISLLVSDDEAYAGLSRRLDSRHYWKRLAPQARVHVFPGGHEDVLGPLESGSFGEVLRDALDEALGRPDRDRTPA
jgi:thioesterase domain-containing protein